MPQPAEHLAPGQFFGRMATHRQVAGMSLFESAYAPSLVIQVHDHELASVCLVLEGSYDEAVGRQRRVCMPGMVIFHPEGEHHADVHHGAPVRLLSIEVGRAKLAALQAAAPVLGESMHLADAESSRTAARLAREFRSSDSASDLAIESLLLDLLVRSQRRAPAEPAGAPPWLARAQAFLHANFARSVGLQEVASAAGVHAAHLARVFRRHHRCTIGAYVRRLRIDAARGHLANGEQPLADVALAAGFADQSHFSRLFRAATGVTPTHYRRLRGRLDQA
jgi:AraC family transcriptional regulator